MKHGKKGMAALVAALLLGSIAVPLSAGAVTYDPCDVNHDGSVDISDVIAINQHLCGAKYYRNYNQLDANRSHTVDAADAQCVLAKVTKNTYYATYMRKTGNLLETVAMPSVSAGTVTLDSYAQTSESRWYVGYSYLTKQPIARYQLNPTFANLPTHSIIGTDDRLVSKGSENTGIVEFSSEGTGFIVGDHEIATAAHCVYQSQVTSGAPAPGIRKNLKIYTYDTAGNKVDGGDLTVAEIHVPEKYKKRSDYEYDYALITVKEDLSGYTHFQIGNIYNMTSSEVSSIPIHVTGAPDDSNHTLYSANGSIYAFNNQTRLLYTTDTSWGQSGSPVYTITSERVGSDYHTIYTALAIHTQNRNSHIPANYGPLMTWHQLMFYMNNDRANY